MSFNSPETFAQPQRRSAGFQNDEPEASVHGDVLRRLLEQEHYLRLIFRHLVDHGLHECRRVCKKWLAVCNEMPVDLPKIQEDRLELLTRKFPNARSVSFYSSDGQETCPDPFAHLVPMQHLVSFVWTSAHKWPIKDSTGPTFQALALLQSITISFACDDCALDFCLSLSGLTNLTKLVITLDRNSVGRNLSMFQLEPISQVQGIRELHIWSEILFQGDSGDLLFPFLTGLTKLKVYSYAESRHLGEIVLKRLEAYGQSLCCLDLESSRLNIEDWSDLSKLVKLESLCAPALLCMFRNNLLEVLTESDHRLTELVLTPGYVTPEFRLSLISSLTGLRSLKLITSVAMSQMASNPLSQLTQLTSLTLSCGSIGTILCCLRSLVRISLVISRTSGPRLVSTWGSMPHLEFLQIWCMDGSEHLPSSVIWQSRKLRCLNLSGVKVDQDFMKALATLPDLTQLSFSKSREQNEVSQLLSQVTLLSSLQCLELRKLGMQIPNPCDYFPDGSLPRLRSLTLDHGIPGNKKRAYDDPIAQELRRRLPSLNHVYQ